MVKKQNCVISIQTSSDIFMVYIKTGYLKSIGGNVENRFGTSNYELDD